MSSGRALVLVVCITACAHEPDPATLAACQGPRADVRLLKDADAAAVNQTPDASSIETLGSFDPPTDPSAPRTASERHAYGVTAWLLAVRGSVDGDATLLLKGESGATMLAHLPPAACLRGSPAADSVASARDTLRYLLEQQGGSHIRVRVRVNGVLYFSGQHGDGDAPNGAELSPVLAIETR